MTCPVQGVVCEEFPYFKYVCSVYNASSFLCENTLWSLLWKIQEELVGIMFVLVVCDRIIISAFPVLLCTDSYPTC